MHTVGHLFVANFFIVNQLMKIGNYIRKGKQVIRGIQETIFLMGTQVLKDQMEALSLIPCGNVPPTASHTCTRT